MSQVKAIPEGYASVTPYLTVRSAEEALAFYAKAFSAKEHLRLNGPDGAIAHCEFKIGDSILMMGSEHPQMGGKSPTTLGSTPVSFMVYVHDCDALFKQAIAAGATEVEPLTDQFYGDRTGKVRCPFGHVWMLATHKEDLSEKEIIDRMMKLYG